MHYLLNNIIIGNNIILKGLYKVYYMHEYLKRCMQIVNRDITVCNKREVTKWIHGLYMCNIR